MWVDGVHFNVRLEDDRLCTLVMIGACPDGSKELVAVEDGYRESAESWASLLRDLKRRGMSAPLVAVCLLYTSPSPRDRTRSRMPSSA